MRERSHGNAERYFVRFRRPFFWLPPGQRGLPPLLYPYLRLVGGDAVAEAIKP